LNHDRSLTPGYGAIVTTVTALVTYAIALKNGFAFDDVVLIPNDPRVTNGQLTALITTPYWNDAALSLYRPLTSLTFGLDWFIAQGSATWFHFTNIVWHMAASALVYALLLRYFSVVSALVGAALFAAHPVHVEAVANVVGRGELIAATFVLLGCVLWCRIPQRAARATIISAIYFLALCGKEGAAVMPALLVMLDFADDEWRLQTLPAYVRRRGPELLALIATFAIFMAIRTSVLGTVSPSRLDPSLEVLTSQAHRIMTALQAWPMALKLFVFPDQLLADYGPHILMPITDWNTLAVLGLTLVLVTVGGGITAIATGNRKMALGLLWYPIAILPVANFIVPIGVLLAERTLYLPSVAFSFAVAALYMRAQERARFGPRALSVMATVLIVALGARAIVRVPDWTSTDRILAKLTEDRPDAFRGQWHMARMARATGNVEKALTTYDKAMKLWPYREGLVQETALYASSQGRAGYARDVAFYGTQRWPQNVAFHRVLAGNALDLGDTATAVRALRRGLELHPGDTLLNQMWRAAAPNSTR
jgi:protein O-mannosyl-transferase